MRRIRRWAHRAGNCEVRASDEAHRTGNREVSIIAGRAHRAGNRRVNLIEGDLIAQATAR